MAKMMTKAELGQLLRLSPRSIDRRIAAGDFPRGVRLGGAVRWSLDSVERWLADRTAEAQDQPVPASGKEGLQ